MLGDRRLKARIAELEGLLQQAYRHDLEGGGHRYYGGDCRHNNHGACLVVCKTCRSPCVCPCHIPGDLTAPRAHVVSVVQGRPLPT